MSCLFADCVSWEFCNSLAWDIPGIQSGREGFSCKLETSLYCREGHLWAPTDETQRNRAFPGNSEETVWRQLAHRPAACWKCKENVRLKKKKSKAERRILSILYLLKATSRSLYLHLCCNVLSSVIFFIQLWAVLCFTLSMLKSYLWYTVKKQKEKDPKHSWWAMQARKKQETTAVSLLKS